MSFLQAALLGLALLGGDRGRPEHAALLRRTAPPPAYQLVPFDVLRVGDCFFSPESAADVPVSDPGSDRVARVPCGQPHTDEVFATVPLTDQAFPGADRLRSEVARACALREADFVLDDWLLPTGVLVQNDAPDERAWQPPARPRAVCALDSWRVVTRSLRQDPARLDPDQLAYLRALSGYWTGWRAEPNAPAFWAPADNRAWLDGLAGATRDTLQALRARSWGERTAQPMAAQLAQLQHVLALLEQARQPTGDSGLLDLRIQQARDAAGDTAAEAAVRAALHLPAVPHPHPWTRVVPDDPLPARTRSGILAGEHLNI
ncbi:hypothetical protein ACFW1A_09675 [Kitasatospora sp. NPDC058965]|uniref:hypothetical protein n=1 Tax=Kitasatospora sp. NPDC058965 TaxID=3346682 RepID=UPI0036972703